MNWLPDFSQFWCAYALGGITGFLLGAGCGGAIVLAARMTSFFDRQDLPDEQ